MKGRRLLGGLSSAASIILVGSLVAAPTASAAGVPPTSYTVVARAYPLYWEGSSGLSVGEKLRVPYVAGMTNNLPVAEASAAIALPDLSVTAMSGPAVEGLTCEGYEEKRCRTDAFLPEAAASHRSPDPATARQRATFGGPEGKAPGAILALNQCGGDCGKQLVRSHANAEGPPGGIPGYISVSGSVASHDVTVDDNGRLHGVARSELRNGVIGPEGEVTFSRLTSISNASGTGADNSKGGTSTIEVTDMVILGYRVELTSAGLRLAHGGLSEQEAYDGAKALLAKLRDERGITLEFGNLAGDVTRKAAHVTVQTKALRVKFAAVQTANGVASSRIEQVMDLGSSTVLVAAFDSKRRIDVSYEGDDMVVEAEPEPAPTSASAPPPAPAPAGGGPAETGAPGQATISPGGTDGERSAPSRLRPSGKVKFTLKNRAAAKPPADPAEVAAPAPAPAEPTTPAPSEPDVSELPVTPAAPTEPDEGPDEVTIGIGDLTSGLRDARTVTRAFGAFLALGLVLPLARFVIRRCG
ncbi:MAG: hypothetical protein ACRDY7_17620 [Acidimicrobiia bacterium]